MYKYRFVFTFVLVLTLRLFSFQSIEDLPSKGIPQEIAAITGITEKLVVKNYDISMHPDFDSYTLHLRVICSLHNKGPVSIEHADFDIFAREKMYCVKVGISNISQLINGKPIPQQFSHGCEPNPEELHLKVSLNLPKITRVTLSPRLEAGGEIRLQFDYSFTQIEPSKKDYNSPIISVLPNGSKEICLISDFPWLPQVAWDFKKIMSLFRSNFFPKLPKPTWKVSIIHPSDYEVIVIDGQLEKIEVVGNTKVSQWKWCTGGSPQVFIGQSDKVEVKGEEISVVFLLPRGEYQSEIVEAMGNFLIRAYRFYSNLYGRLDGKDIHVAVSSSGMGGHGAFLGMILDASIFQPEEKEGKLSPSELFYDIQTWDAYGLARVCAHELAHSWWGLSVSSYGRGTKFLRESLTEFSTWHFARKCFGIDKFKNTLAILFITGEARDPLFNLKNDRSRLAYGKGPFVLEMLRKEMGDEIFFKSLKHFATKYEDSYVTFTDFVSVCNEISQRDWMPFFNQWCYGEGFPIYHLASFESKKDISDWQTTVAIRNDGKGLVRCPLELLMGKEAQKEFFFVPEGEEVTFNYRTSAKVDEVIIDPEHTTYQGDDKEALQKVLAFEDMLCDWKYYNKGLFYGERGENEKAVDYLSRAIKSQRAYVGYGKAHPAFYFSRGIIYLHMGKRKKANDDLRIFIDRLLEMAKKSPELTMTSLGYAGVISGSAQERRNQLDDILRIITNRYIVFDPKLDGWREWWQANRESFQVSPNASALSPRGIK